MQPDPQRLRANIQRASTEDLLARATVYRTGMEEEALLLIEQELRRRGVSSADWAAHEAKLRQEVLFDERGVARKCWKCRRPAVHQSWTWHRLWGLVPLFPRRVFTCPEHQPGRKKEDLTTEDTEVHRGIER